MKISQVILKGVNNFQDFSYSFEDEWSKSIPDTLLFMGPNGSGKTTVLRCIANLWGMFGFLLEGQKQFLVKHTSIFSGCQLAAIAIENFLPEISQTVWICVGNPEEIKRLVQDTKESHKISVCLKENSFTIKYLPPCDIEAKDSELAEAWLEALTERFIKNRLGGRSDMPNVIFLESEKRTLVKIKDEQRVLPEVETFQWLAFYNTTARRQGSIQNYLFTLKAIHEQKYEQIVTAANQYLGNKKITGFDRRTGELLITTQSGKTHPVYLLSSGEKQVLLMIAFIARELRPGGVVLIDEPDLHLHVSLSHAFVSYLKRMITEQNGQLIIASHAPSLWQHFTEQEQIELGKEL